MIQAGISRPTAKYLDDTSGAGVPSTLGELIVALTDETREFIHDEEEVYRVVAYMVADILFRSRVFSKKWH